MSPQGKNKSKAARILAVKDEWFSDNLPIGADPEEVIEQMGGVWIAELGELAGMGSRHADHVGLLMEGDAKACCDSLFALEPLMLRNFCGMTKTGAFGRLKLNGLILKN